MHRIGQRLIRQSSTKNLASLLEQISLALLFLIPFLVPFNASKNADLQAYLLVFTGLTSWLFVGLKHKYFVSYNSRITLVLLGIFIISCLLSAIFNPHLGYDLFGSPYIRLGALGLISCIGCALLLQKRPTKQLLFWLYIEIVCLSIVSLPYSLLKFHSLLRLGGVFSQADIFAVILGCGLILGEYYRQLTAKKWPILAQLLLASLLLLTQTRSIIFLLIILYPFYRQFGRNSWKPSRLLVYLVLVAFLVVGSKFLISSRLTNVNYLGKSISYRLDLQRQALEATQHKPLLGYGPGNLADALACDKIQTTVLSQTCREGYFFNSSHNIFIDRILAVGWIGGLAYAAFVFYSLIKGFVGGQAEYVFVWCSLLVVAYYFTNVTSAILEFLFLVFLLRLVKHN